VRVALDRLKPDKKAVMEMHLEGFSAQEISETLKVKVNTVRTRMFYALRDMAQYLHAQSLADNLEDVFTKDELVRLEEVSDRYSKKD